METLSIEVIMILTVGLVEYGKRKLPSLFTSDLNALLTIVIAGALNSGNALVFGGSVQAALQAGVIAGATTAGLYRAVSGLSKNRSIDFSEQALPLTVSHDKGDDGEDGANQIGFTK
jgi:hypothetical protein